MRDEVVTGSMRLLAEARKSKLARKTLFQGFGCGQHLIRFRTHPNIFSEIHPPHYPGGIHQKLRRPGNIAAFWPTAFVQQMITANRHSIGIGQDWERISGLARQFSRDFGSIHANGHRLYPGFSKLVQIFFDAS